MPERRTILTADADFQLATALLTNRKQRGRQRRFVVQGVKPIDAALRHGWRFDSIWTPRGKSLSRWAADLIARSGARTHVEAAPDLFAELAEKAEPGEVVAIVELPESGLSDLHLGPAPLVVVLDRPSSPGNLGSILRTANAFGAGAVIVTGHAADLYDPQTVRASVGALFATPAVQHVAPAEAAGWLAAAAPAIRIVGTSAKAERSLDETDLAGPLALIFGNEAAGLSAAWRELCHDLVSIPTAGVASSLNLASAAAIVLNEARRSRR